MKNKGIETCKAVGCVLTVQTLTQVYVGNPNLCHYHANAHKACQHEVTRRLNELIVDYRESEKVDRWSFAVWIYHIDDFHLDLHSYVIKGRKKPPLPTAVYTEDYLIRKMAEFNPVIFAPRNYVPIYGQRVV